MGTYTVVNGAPSVVSVSPASGSGNSQTFAVTVADSGGAEADLPIEAVLEALTTLVEQSLVVQHEDPCGESRFDLLDSIHEFSREQLAARGTAPVRQSERGRPRHRRRRCRQG